MTMTSCTRVSRIGRNPDSRENAQEAQIPIRNRDLRLLRLFAAIPFAVPVVHPTDQSVTTRRPANSAGAGDGDLFVHQEKKRTAALAGWMSPKGNDGAIFVVARFPEFRLTPQKSFDKRPGSIR